MNIKMVLRNDTFGTSGKYSKGDNFYLKCGE